MIKWPEPAHKETELTFTRYGVKEEVAASFYSEAQLKQAVRDALEEAAKVAEVRWQVLKETEEAHYRLSPINFDPARFGFEMSVCNESRDIATAIRALIKEVV